MMKNKRTMKLITLLLSCILVIGAAIGISAAAAEESSTAPQVRIAGTNLSYENTLKLVYRVQMNAYAENGDYTAYLLRSNEEIAAPSVGDALPEGAEEMETSAEIDGVTYYIVRSEGIGMKNVRKNVYARPVLVDGEGKVAAVGQQLTYSPYQYVMNVFNGSATDDQKALYSAVLEFAGAVQEWIIEGDSSVTIESLGGWADAIYSVEEKTYVDGTFLEGSTKTYGPLRTGETVTITAEATYENRMLAGFGDVADAHLEGDLNYVAAPTVPGTTTVTVNYGKFAKFGDNYGYEGTTASAMVGAGSLVADGTTDSVAATGGYATVGTDGVNSYLAGGRVDTTVGEFKNALNFSQIAVTPTQLKQLVFETDMKLDIVNTDNGEWNLAVTLSATELDSTIAWNEGLGGVKVLPCNGQICFTSYKIKDGAVSAVVTDATYTPVVDDNGDPVIDEETGEQKQALAGGRYVTDWFKLKIVYNVIDGASTMSVYTAQKDADGNWQDYVLVNTVAAASHGATEIRGVQLCTRSGRADSVEYKLDNSRVWAVADSLEIAPNRGFGEYADNANTITYDDTTKVTYTDTEDGNLMYAKPGIENEDAVGTIGKTASYVSSGSALITLAGQSATSSKVYVFETDINFLASSFAAGDGNKPLLINLTNASGATVVGYKILCGDINSGAQSYMTFYGANLNIGKWYNLRIEFNPTTLKTSVWVDGTQVATDSTDATYIHVAADADNAATYGGATIQIRRQGGCTTKVLLDNTYVGPKPVAHEHTFTWTYDANYHWQVATCGCTGLEDGKAEHTLDENGKCTVCGYVNYRGSGLYKDSSVSYSNLEANSANTETAGAWSENGVFVGYQSLGGGASSFAEVGGDMAWTISKNNANAQALFAIGLKRVNAKMNSTDAVGANQKVVFETDIMYSSGTDTDYFFFAMESLNNKSGGTRDLIDLAGMVNGTDMTIGSDMTFAKGVWYNLRVEITPDGDGSATVTYYVNHVAVSAAELATHPATMGRVWFTLRSASNDIELVLDNTYLGIVDLPAETHEHTYSDEWTKDDTNHWHAATCSENDDCATAVADKAAHTYVDGVCECGQEEPVAETTNRGSGIYKDSSVSYDNLVEDSRNTETAGAWLENSVWVGYSSIGAGYSNFDEVDGDKAWVISKVTSADAPGSQALFAVGLKRMNSNMTNTTVAANQKIVFETDVMYSGGTGATTSGAAGFFRISNANKSVNGDILDLDITADGTTMNIGDAQLTKGVWYTLRVEVVSGVVTMYLNGTSVYTVTLDAHPTTMGRVYFQFRGASYDIQMTLDNTYLALVTEE